MQMSMRMNAKNPKPLVWPIPPRIGQNIALLPDGTFDPQHANDCGESCVASVVSALRGITVSPGCWREALGDFRRTGMTTAGDLQRLLVVPGLTSYADHSDAETQWGHLTNLRHYAAYSIILGSWLSTTEFHWLLAYERAATVVWTMDPWTASYRPMGVQEFCELYAGVAVRIWQ